MTREEAVKLLVLIESVYSKFILKDETVLHWFEYCAEMDYEKVLAKLKNHIRKSPFPPTVADIAVVAFEENDVPMEGQETVEPKHINPKRKPAPDWLLEYSIRKSV